MSKSLDELRDEAYLEWLYPTKFNFTNREEVIKTSNFKHRSDYEAFCIAWDTAIKYMLKKEDEFAEVVEFVLSHADKEFGWLNLLDEAIKKRANKGL